MRQQTSGFLPHPIRAAGSPAPAKQEYFDLSRSPGVLPISAVRPRLSAFYGFPLTESAGRQVGLTWLRPTRFPVGLSTEDFRYHIVFHPSRAGPDLRAAYKVPVSSSSLLAGYLRTARSGNATSSASSNTGKAAPRRINIPPPRGGRQLAISETVPGLVDAVVFHSVVASETVRTKSMRLSPP